MKFDIWAWICEQNAKLQSPIIQLFVRPLGKPFIAISDWRETEDVMLKRNEYLIGVTSFEICLGLSCQCQPNEITSGLSCFEVTCNYVVIDGSPRTFAHIKTNEVYWQHRNLMSSAMSTSFLGSVAASQFHDKALDLISRWKQKESPSPR